MGKKSPIFPLAFPALPLPLRALTCAQLGPEVRSPFRRAPPHSPLPVLSETESLASDLQAYTLSPRFRVTPTTWEQAPGCWGGRHMAPQRTRGPPVWEISEEAGGREAGQGSCVPSAGPLSPYLLCRLWAEMLAHDSDRKSTQFNFQNNSHNSYFKFSLFVEWWKVKLNQVFTFPFRVLSCQITGGAHRVPGHHSALLTQRRQTASLGAVLGRGLLLPFCALSRDGTWRH